MARKVVDDEIPRCETEPDVIRALGRGVLSGDLLQHAQACVVCSEVCEITRQLHLIESSMEKPRESAAGVWWRLNLRLRRQQMNRAQMPLVWMGRVCAATLLLITFFALWQVSANRAVFDVLIIGLLALAAVALPAMIVLWRWSRS
jgi:hypothetical protein